MPNDPLCVLLLESEAWRFIGISTFLRSRGFEVIGPTDCNATLDLPDAQPDVVMLAHTFLHACGQEIVDRIARTYPNTVILAHGDDERVDTMASLITLGIRGYFLLSAPREQLLEAIAVVRSGGIWAPRTALALLAQRRDTSPQRTNDPGEQLILQMLRDGLSNKEMAARLGLAEVTVKSRLTRLYRHYGVRTRLQLLTSAMRQNTIRS